MKTCNRCKKEKSIIEFYKNNHNKDHYSNICTSCRDILYKFKKIDEHAEFIPEDFKIPYIPAPTYAERIALKLLVDPTEMEEIRYKFKKQKKGWVIWNNVQSILYNWRK